MHRTRVATLRARLPLIGLVGVVALGAAIAVDGPAAGATTGYVFDDEFTGSHGSQPPQWAYQTGGSGWGNNEVQQYTSRPSNAQLDGLGHLVINAKRETYTGADGITRNFTSARMYTKTPVNFGYVEARIALPPGQGLWPGFWTLGGNITSVDWPTCGEIDVVEAVNQMEKAVGTVHGADTTARTAYKYGGSAAPSSPLAYTWHTFAVSKTTTSISWYLDGVRYYTLARSALRPGQVWAFDQPQYLLLNVAVGGDWAGPPTAATPAKSSMLVDWIHAGSGIPSDAQ